MFLDGAKLHQPGRILLPVSSSRTGRPIARSAEELSSTWPSPADITVDLDHRPNWTERIVELRLRPTVGDLSLGRRRHAEVAHRELYAFREVVEVDKNTHRRMPFCGKQMVWWCKANSSRLLGLQGKDRRAGRSRRCACRRGILKKAF